MKSVFAAFALAFHLLTSAGMPVEIIFWSTPTVRGNVTTTDHEIHYTGDIDAAVAKTIVNLIESLKYDTLQIQSEGGDQIAARLIGTSVFDHQMTVVVSGQCSSSCARYVFTAAKRKQIKPGAFVMFSEYQSYHDYVQLVMQLSERKEIHGVTALSEIEKQTLVAGDKWVGLEKTYFTKIGVDMRIASLGYLHGRSVSHWLLTGKRMAEFGVSNVTLPDKYGSQEYCDKIKISGFLRFDAQCL